MTDTFVDEPTARLQHALDALHPSARYVRVEAIDLQAALDQKTPPAPPRFRADDERRWAEAERVGVGTDDYRAMLLLQRR